MNQAVIDKFNAGTAANDLVFAKAEKAGFPWMYFMERAEAKARESGYLPREGYLIFDARYVNSAERVVAALFASLESVGDAHTFVGWCTPWKDSDLQRWKDVACSLSCTAFDAGVVAAFTRAPEGEEDPIARNGAASIWGDVGFMGLREKSLSFMREIGGDQAKSLMGEIGDCACLHLYADRLNSERVFRMDETMREAYVRNACRAAYLAGAVFAEKVMAEVLRTSSGL